MEENEIEALKNSVVFKKTEKYFVSLFWKEQPSHFYAIHPENLEVKKLKPEIFEGDVQLIKEQDWDRYFTDNQLQLYFNELQKHIESLSLSVSSECADVEWVSTRLTFLKRHIAPLNDAQTFAIHIIDDATYVMSKRDFLNEFNNVAQSRSYQVYGSYNYSQTPQRAVRFIV